MREILIFVVSVGVMISLILVLLFVFTFTNSSDLKKAPMVKCEHIHIDNYNAARCLVPHGWIVRINSCKWFYYPDEKHEWKIEKEKN